MTKLIITITLMTVTICSANSKDIEKQVEKRLSTILMEEVKIINKYKVILSELSQNRLKKAIPYCIEKDEALKLSKVAYLNSFFKLFALIMIDSEFKRGEYDLSKTIYKKCRASIYRKKCKINEQQQNNFLNSKIEIVLGIGSSYSLRIKRNYLLHFKFLRNMYLHGFANSSNSYKIPVSVLNHSPNTILFNGSIWGELPLPSPKYFDNPDKIKITMHIFYNLPIYRYSPIMIDRKRKTFAITNLPPGIYQLNIIDTANNREIGYNVDINEKAVFLKYDKNKDYKQSGIDNGIDKRRTVFLIDEVNNFDDKKTKK